jgi:hypothetical protein
MRIFKNITKLIVPISLSASAILASNPTWMMAEYRDGKSNRECSVSGVMCQKKTWQECVCKPCYTQPTDQAGKDGCDCGAISNHPTQVSVFNGACIDVALINPSGPRTGPAGGGTVKICTYGSTPSGVVENKPGCNLDATPN